jgi:hypothetical protein
MLYCWQYFDVVSAVLKLKSTQKMGSWQAFGRGCFCVCLILVNVALWISYATGSTILVCNDDPLHPEQSLKVLTGRTIAMRSSKGLGWICDG